MASRICGFTLTDSRHSVFVSPVGSASINSGMRVTRPSGLYQPIEPEAAKGLAVSATVIADTGRPSPSGYGADLGQTAGIRKLLPIGDPRLDLLESEADLPSPGDLAIGFRAAIRKGFSGKPPRRCTDNSAPRQCTQGDPRRRSLPELPAASRPLATRKSANRAEPLRNLQ